MNGSHKETNFERGGGGEILFLVPFALHDFHYREAKDIRNKVLARRMEKVKNSETEVARMCEVMEEYREEGRAEGREEGREEGRISTIRELVEGGLPLEKIFELLKIPENDRTALRERLV